MFRNLTVLLVMALGCQSYAQSSEVQAKAAFMSAQEYYGNGDFPMAIDRLNSVKELLGSSNPRVEYLLTQCYMGSDQPEKAEMSLKSYFEMAAEDDPNYSIMLLSIEQLKKQKELVQQQREAEQKEQRVWKEAVAINTSQSYEVYLAAYPDGKFRTEAVNNIASMPLVDARDGNIYKVKRMNGLLWMMENLRYNALNSVCYKEEDENCEKFGRLYTEGSINILCPKGWRLPTWQEAKQALESQGNFEFKLVPGDFYMRSDKSIHKRLINANTMNLWLGGVAHGQASALSPTGGGSGKTKFVQQGKSGMYWAQNGANWGVSREWMLVYKTNRFSSTLSCRCVKEL